MQRREKKMFKNVASALFIFLFVAVALSGCATTSYRHSQEIGGRDCDANARGYVMLDDPNCVETDRTVEFYVNDMSEPAIVIAELLPKDSILAIRESDLEVTTVSVLDGYDRTIIHLGKHGLRRCLTKLLTLEAITGYAINTRMADPRFLDACERGFDTTFLNEPDGDGVEWLGVGYVITQAGFQYCYFAWLSDGSVKMAVNGLLPADVFGSIPYENENTEIEALDHIGDRKEVWIPEGDNTFTRLEFKNPSEALLDYLQR